MWHAINNQGDVQNFMGLFGYFHDSCIKEMKYTSGAYVNDDLSMYPVNDSRVLKLIIQRQCADNSMVEMEFEGLKQLRLNPCDENYTCEILDATMIFKGDCIYWCDRGGVPEAEMSSYKGTMICASKLRWRRIDGCMGQKEFYVQLQEE